MPPLKSIAIPVKHSLRRSKAKSASARTEEPEVFASTPVELHRPATPVVAQLTHRFRIGERLRMTNGGRSFSRAEAYCKVVARLPYEGHGALLYRVRSETEQFERVVAEIDLSRNEHVALE